MSDVTEIVAEAMADEVVAEAETVAETVLETASEVAEDIVEVAVDVAENITLEARFAALETRMASIEQAHEGYRSCNCPEGAHEPVVVVDVAESEEEVVVEEVQEEEKETLTPEPEPIQADEPPEEQHWYFKKRNWMGGK